jgi:hypothetical protein
MKMARNAGVVALGLLSLLAGCAGAGESETLDMGRPPAAEPQTGGSSTGTNGLGSPDYWSYENWVSAATTLPLTSGSTAVTNPVVLNMVSSTKGKTVFQYMVTCALDRNTSVTLPNGDTFTGGGPLLRTTGWTNSALSADAKHDLLECMAIHLNPLNIHVHILLSGSTVAEDGSDHSIFNVDEALWAVEETNGDRVYYVWPLPTFEADCHLDPGLALKDRVCGQNPVSCSLVVRHDRATACSLGNDGMYTCDGKPAIRSALTTEGFNALYPPMTSVCPPL